MHIHGPSIYFQESKGFRFEYYSLPTQQCQHQKAITKITHDLRKPQLLLYSTRYWRILPPKKDSQIGFMLEACSKGKTLN